MNFTFTRQPAAEADQARDMRRLFGDEIPPSAFPEVYYGFDSKGRFKLLVLLSREQWTPDDERWHISISAKKRVPDWNEITYTIHKLRPGVPFVLGVPPRSWWMNLASYALHAWETKDEALIDQWRANALGHTPT